MSIPTSFFDSDIIECNNIDNTTNNNDDTYTENKNVLFPSKLHRILQEESDVNEKNDSSIISWMPQGLSFKIHDRERFEKEMMPKYFSSSKIRSFQKSLNMWGFKLLKKNDPHHPNIPNGGWFHPFFQKNKPNLLLRMTRKPVNNNNQNGNCNGNKNNTNKEEQQQQQQAQPCIKKTSKREKNTKLENSEEHHEDHVSTGGSRRSLPALSSRDNLMEEVVVRRAQEGQQGRLLSDYQKFLTGNPKTSSNEQREIAKLPISLTKKEEPSYYPPPLNDPISLYQEEKREVDAGTTVGRTYAAAAAASGGGGGSCYTNARPIVHALRTARQHHGMKKTNRDHEYGGCNNNNGFTNCWNTTPNDELLSSSPRYDLHATKRRRYSSSISNNSTTSSSHPPFTIMTSEEAETAATRKQEQIRTISSSFAADRRTTTYPPTEEDDTKKSAAVSTEEAQTWGGTNRSWEYHHHPQQHQGRQQNDPIFPTMLQLLLQNTTTGTIPASRNPTERIETSLALPLPSSPLGITTLQEELEGSSLLILLQKLLLLEQGGSLEESQQSNSTYTSNPSNASTTRPFPSLSSTRGMAAAATALTSTGRMSSISANRLEELMRLRLLQTSTTTIPSSSSNAANGFLGSNMIGDRVAIDHASSDRINRLISSLISLLSHDLPTTQIRTSTLPPPPSFDTRYSHLHRPLFGPSPTNQNLPFLSNLDEEMKRILMLSLSSLVFHP